MSEATVPVDGEFEMARTFTVEPELERALEQPGRHTIRAELREGELGQEDGEEDAVTALLHDPSQVACEVHRRRRPVTKKRGEDSGDDDLGPQPRIGLGLDERLIEESLRSLEVVGRTLAETPQHLRALGTRR